jgi:hypothetical protein
MTQQQEQTVELMWSWLMTLPPNVRHEALAALRERLERIPAVMLNHAVLTRGEQIEEAMDRR